MKDFGFWRFFFFRVLRASGWFRRVFKGFERVEYGFKVQS